MGAKLKTKSDVPRFLAMLKDYHIPAEYCIDLFSDWCSSEGDAVLAKKCMIIQSKLNSDITAVWEWVYNNKCSMHTDWREEVDRFKEVIMTKLTKEELFKKAQERFKKAQERFSSWARMYANPDVTTQQMYEDMFCSCYSGDTDTDTDTDLELDTECERPVGAKLKTKSDVPRFLAMLKENSVPAEYCVGLFSCWCSCEGTAATAEKCMDIQTKYGITMTAVWEWVCTNEPCPDTDWTEEVDRFKEVLND